MVEGCFCYDGGMLTKTDKNWIDGELATKEDLSVARIALKTEMSKMEQRIEEKAQARHDEILDRLENVVGVTD